MRNDPVNQANKTAEVVPLSDVSGCENIIQISLGKEVANAIVAQAKYIKTIRSILIFYFIMFLLMILFVSCSGILSLATLGGI